MSRLLKKQFLAEINVCDRKGIVRNITVIGNGMHPRTAKLRALARMKELKEEGRSVSLHPVQAIWSEDKITCAPLHNSTQTEVDYHEHFHGEVERCRVRKKIENEGTVEESGAHAFETTRPIINRRQQKELETDIRRNTMLARHSVRFMFALYSNESNGLLATSMGILRRETTIIAGDSISAALNATKNYLLYIECLAVLRCMGTEEGKEAIFEAIRTEYADGLSKARGFLVSQLPRTERRRLDGIYGIDLRTFRFRSPYHPDVVTEDWVLE